MLRMYKFIFHGVKQTLCLFNMKIIFAFFIATSLALNANADSTDQDLEYKVKAAYLYNFTKFISWPDKAFSNETNQTLNICIYGVDPFGHAIDLLNNKKAKGRNVTIEYVVDVNNKTTDTQCHVAFISKSYEKELVSVLEYLTNKNILTVSDIGGFAIKGGCIGLGVVRGKVRFNVNLKSTQAAELKVSAKLLELAKVVIE